MKSIYYSKCYADMKKALRKFSEKEIHEMSQEEFQDIKNNLQEDIVDIYNR